MAGILEGRNFLVSAALAALVTIPVTRWLFPDLIPMTMADVWDTHGTSPLEWVLVGAPVYLWGVFLTLAIAASRGWKQIEDDPVQIFVGGAWVSLRAGVLEEIAFRWLLFLGAIPGLYLVNYLFFGCLGFGIAENLHLYIWGPLSNLTTFGFLESHMYPAAEAGGWVVGAAMLASNAFFRDGHKYQGPVGIVNSWFGGMYLFWVMFNYGLAAGIVVHVIYDLLIFSTRAAQVAIQRRMARRRRTP